MNLLTLLKTAFEALGRNRMRTILSILGIVIGIASVVAMLSIGEGSKNSIREQITDMGTNMITIMPNRFNRSGAQIAWSDQAVLEYPDVQTLINSSNYLQWISPVVQRRGQFISGCGNWPSQLQGVSEDFIHIRRMGVASGRFFTLEEEQQAAKVCLLGKTVADNLFPGGTDPIGEWIRFNKKPLQVIGILESKGANSFGQDQDDIVLAPWSTVQRRILSTTRVNSIVASLEDESLVDSATAEIEYLLTERRPQYASEEGSAVMVRSQKEMLDMLGSTAKTLSTILTVVAALSLLVGGIGIMNIMLVSVTERIREIGLRMAVGARERDILLQFLLESVLVSLIGGLIGIATGLAASLVVHFLLGWPIAITPTALFLSFGVCVSTGVIFGWLPARKAAQLDPITALRRE